MKKSDNNTNIPLANFTIYSNGNAAEIQPPPLPPSPPLPRSLADPQYLQDDEIYANLVSILSTRLRLSVIYQELITAEQVLNDLRTFILEESICHYSWRLLKAQVVILFNITLFAIFGYCFYRFNGFRQQYNDIFISEFAHCFPKRHSWQRLLPYLPQCLCPADGLSCLYETALRYNLYSSMGFLFLLSIISAMITIFGTIHYLISTCKNTYNNANLRRKYCQDATLVDYNLSTAELLSIKHPFDRLTKCLMVSGFTISDNQLLEHTPQTAISALCTLIELIAFETVTELSSFLQPQEIAVWTRLTQFSNVAVADNNPSVNMLTQQLYHHRSLHKNSQLPELLKLEKYQVIAKGSYNAIVYFFQQTIPQIDFAKLTIQQIINCLEQFVKSQQSKTKQLSFFPQQRRPYLMEFDAHHDEKFLQQTDAENSVDMCDTSDSEDNYRIVNAI